MKKILKFKQNKQPDKLEKEMYSILNGLADVIKVYKTDYSILFFNDAACSFYNKTPEEVKGKKCYEILSRESQCTDCPFQIVMKTKKMVVKERYIPELNTYMDVCCNPVLDEAGQVAFVIERLRDITDKKILDNLLKESEEKYRQIVDSTPNAVIIIEDNRVALANKEACELLGTSYEKLIGSNIYMHIDPNQRKFIYKTLMQVSEEKKEKKVYNYDSQFLDGEGKSFQVTSSYINYQGKAAILSVIIDITDMKKDLSKAKNFQENSLQKSFPIVDKVNMARVYVPAKTVGGDFYQFYKVNEDLVIGIILDVSGKGITAALNISAVYVLFLQEVLATHEPSKITKNLNRKLINFFQENYIAACCFSMDFSKKQLKIVGAGINQFMFQKSGAQVEIKTVEGAFLGMFPNSVFEEQVIQFHQKDRVFFFTDGLDFILDEDKVIRDYMEEVSIIQFTNYINEFLNDTLIETGSLMDDCTMVALEII